MVSRHSSGGQQRREHLFDVPSTSGPYVRNVVLMLLCNYFNIAELLHYLQKFGVSKKKGEKKEKKCVSLHKINTFVIIDYLDYFY